MKNLTVILNPTAERIFSGIIINGNPFTVDILPDNEKMDPILKALNEDPNFPDGHSAKDTVLEILKREEDSMELAGLLIACGIASVVNPLQFRPFLPILTGQNPIEILRQVRVEIFTEMAGLEKPGDLSLEEKELITNASVLFYFGVCLELKRMARDEPEAFGPLGMILMLKAMQKKENEEE